MPARRYRTIKTPVGRGKITLEEAIEGAKIVAARFAARDAAATKSNGRVGTNIDAKAVAGSTKTHSPKTSSGAVGKNIKANSTRKGVASKR